MVAPLEGGGGVISRRGGGDFKGWGYVHLLSQQFRCVYSLLPLVMGIPFANGTFGVAKEVEPPLAPSWFPMPAAQAPRVLREQPAGGNSQRDSFVKAPKGSKSIHLSSQIQRV